MFIDIFFNWLNSIFVLTGYVSGNPSFPKPLTAEEEKFYLEQYQNNDPNAKNILIERNLRLVAHICKKYADEKNFEDLISIGTIGLIKGINTYDIEKNSRLSAYISRCIDNEVLMYLRSSKKLSNEISIDEGIGIDKEGNTMTFSDILTAENDDIADLVFNRIEITRLYHAIKQVLTPAEADIIMKRYGLNRTERKTQREIAGELGISRSYVSRIEKRCLLKLEKALRDDVK